MSEWLEAFKRDRKDAGVIFAVDELISGYLRTWVLTPTKCVIKWGIIIALVIAFPWLLLIPFVVFVALCVVQWCVEFKRDGIAERLERGDWH